MDITTFATAPPAADTEPGDLYCDLQTRTLWLGVDDAVDPAGSLLISDIMGMLAAIDAAIVTAKDYTDDAVALRAPINNPVLTGNPQAPTASIVSNSNAIATTAFVKNAVAANTGQFVTGMIMIWAGAKNLIPAGWKLCDGTGGAPDLRDRFVIGAGNKAVDTPNGMSSVTTSPAGAHTPNIQPFALTTNHLPAHTHTFADSFTTAAGGVAHTHSATLTGTTDTEGNHTHSFPHAAPGSGTGGGGSYTGAAGTGVTAGAGQHAHTVSVSGTTGPASAYSHTHTGSISGNTGATGAGAAHDHVGTAVPDHTHSISSANLREAIPYYALCYIMKT